eukprot:GFKZ01000653.1.p1 GENE.GFKZ01000653.1~~GFKZ01000653.1.p1  ORF type:complete len:260 (+),score=41.89 GFKZ01000653.1:264-1043(+)
MDEVINLISDSDNPGPAPSSGPIVDQSYPPSPASSDSDLQIVSQIKRTAVTSNLTQQQSSHPSSSDVECVGSRVGVVALVDYPHFRFQCVIEPFKRQRHTKKLRYCSRCYCYVCDILASECKEWEEHAKANDTVHKWRVEREARLEERRRKDMDEAMRRIPAVARYSRPVAIGEPLLENGSLPSGDDLTEVGEDSDNEVGPEDDDEWDLGDPLKGLELVDEMFQMKGLSQILDEMEGVVLSSEIRNRSRRKAIMQNGLE